MYIEQVLPKEVFDIFFAGLALLIIMLLIIFLKNKLDEQSNLNDKRKYMFVSLMINISALIVLSLNNFFDVIGIVYCSLVLGFDIATMLIYLRDRIRRNLDR